MTQKDGQRNNGINNYKAYQRIRRYFSLMMMSYVIVGCAAGLYLIARSMVLDVEFGKFVQYPTSIPFLVNVFVSFFMLYVCIMIRSHLEKDQKIYKEDQRLLLCMIGTQVLFFNYLSLIPTLLAYFSLRKESFFSKLNYPQKEQPNKFIPIITEGVFYIICFVIIGLTLLFGVLLVVAFLQKR